MSKSGKITVANVTLVCVIITAVATSIMAWIAFFKEKPKLLEADVNLVHWHAPQSVITDIGFIDARETPLDPSRMTAKAIDKSCSMYTIILNNNNKECTKETQMTVPTALYWEVIEQGKITNKCSGTILIPLPGIRNGEEPVKVKVWASCKASRLQAENIQVTQEKNYSAQINIIDGGYERITKKSTQEIN